MKTGQKEKVLIAMSPKQSLRDATGQAGGRRKIKALVAMSGGVDSSVAAALLKERGYFVVGVFMKFWHEPIHKTKEIPDTRYQIPDTNRCCSGDAYEAAKSVCAKLNIPFRALDVQKKFKKAVVDYFLKEYKSGRTPNPCVRCNEEIKFKILLETAGKWGMDYVSTGHYARIKRFVIASDLSREASAKWGAKQSRGLLRRSAPRNDIYKLFQAKNNTKDQSYFIYNLTQGQLRRVLFPIGDYAKEEVRKMAKIWGLATAERPESFEVCFVPDKRTANFLARYIKTKPGKIVDEKSRQIGEHRGLPFYTIGQRHGLIGLKGAGPFYVAAKNPAKNELVAVNNPRSPLLSRRDLIAEKVNWILGVAPKLPIKILARIRYRQSLQEAIIMNYESRISARGGSASGGKNKELKNKSKFIIHNSRFLIRFNNPQKAITPGQSVVFYSSGEASAKSGRGREVLGGGVIV